VLAAQLAESPDITTRIIERRSNPLEVGRAGGVACRTVGMFEAFGLADALLREAYWVNDVRFWAPQRPIARTSPARDGWRTPHPD
jgi:phenol 2-monooxygenase